MKKFTIINTVALILATCLLFAGCTITINSKPDDASNESEVTESVQEESIVEEETIPDIPGAKEFDTFEWPTFGAVTRIPVADWSNRGLILCDSENSFWVQVGYSTKDNYDNYVKACQDAGFTEDYYNIAGYMYYGANADGYFVQLTYNEYDHYIAIQTGSVDAGWNKWWEEEADASVEE